MPSRQPEPVKGAQIYIQSGSYKGRFGWKNTAKRDTAKMAYVIVDMGNGEELATRIKKSSLGSLPDPPSSYTEAAFQQIPDIQYHLKKTAWHLAKSQADDVSEMSRLLAMLFVEAQLELHDLGNKASYYKITYVENMQEENNNNNNNNNNSV